MSDKVCGLIGAIVCVVCTVVFTVKMFGGYPASYSNWIWFTGMFIGALLATSLFEDKE